MQGHATLPLYVTRNVTVEVKGTEIHTHCLILLLYACQFDKPQNIKILKNELDCFSVRF